MIHAEGQNESLEELGFEPDGLGSETEMSSPGLSNGPEDEGWC